MCVMVCVGVTVTLRYAWGGAGNVGIGSKRSVVGGCMGSVDCRSVWKIQPGTKVRLNSMPMTDFVGMRMAVPAWIAAGSATGQNASGYRRNSRRRAERNRDRPPHLCRNRSQTAFRHIGCSSSAQPSLVPWGSRYMSDRRDLILRLSGQCERKFGQHSSPTRCSPRSSAERMPWWISTPRDPIHASIYPRFGPISAAQGHFLPRSPFWRRRCSGTGLV